MCFYGIQSTISSHICCGFTKERGEENIISRQSCFKEAPVISELAWLVYNERLKLLQCWNHLAMWTSFSHFSFQIPQLKCSCCGCIWLERKHFPISCEKYLGFRPPMDQKKTLAFLLQWPGLKSHLMFSH